MGTDATYDNRPTCPPPVDDAHAFFGQPLHVEDPALRGWLGHFRSDPSFPHTYRELGNGTAMIYVHQIQINRRWCCGGAACTTVPIG